MTTEAKFVEIAVKHILASKEPVIMEEIKDHIKKTHTFDKEDSTILKSGVCRWEQLVRNMVSNGSLNHPQIAKLYHPVAKRWVFCNAAHKDTILKDYELEDTKPQTNFNAIFG